MGMQLSDYQKYLKRKIMDQQQAQAANKRGQLHASVGDTRSLSGHQLAATHKFVEQIREEDPELAQTLTGYFKILPKYSALEILCNERSGIPDKFGQQALGILEAVLTEEMREDGTEKRWAELNG